MSGIRDSIEQAYQRAVKGVRTTMGASQIPVGLTPRETIWALNKTRLYRYRSPQPVERRYPVPLLVWARWAIQAPSTSSSATRT